MLSNAAAAAHSATTTGATQAAEARSFCLRFRFDFLFSTMTNAISSIGGVGVEMTLTGVGDEGAESMDIADGVSGGVHGDDCVGDVLLV